jgi:HK97 family phage prohead protease
MTILTRTFAAELHVRDDDRVIAGTLVPYGVPTQVTEFGKTYTEDFAPHAFAADVGRASEIELTALHPRSGDVLPIGVTLTLTDTPAGLDAEFRISQTDFGDDVLTLVRDKALRSLSAGFAEGRNQWHTRDHVTRVTATLDHAALVRRGAYPNARLRGAQPRVDPLQLIARLRPP